MKFQLIFIVILLFIISSRCHRYSLSHPPQHTHTSLFGKKTQCPISCLEYSILFSRRVSLKTELLVNIRETLHTQLFSRLLKATQSKLADFAVRDNLCIQPRVRNLKPYLKYAETHHLRLDGLLSYTFRKDTNTFVKGFIMQFYSNEYQSDFSALGKVNRKGKAKKRKSIQDKS